MQQLFVQKGCMRLLSLPVWEEWIEMLCQLPKTAAIASLPVWEEWIEIVCQLVADLMHPGLFPYGKSGLKS